MHKTLLQTFINRCLAIVLALSVITYPVILPSLVTASADTIDNNQNQQQLDSTETPYTEPSAEPSQEKSILNPDEPELSQNETNLEVTQKPPTDSTYQENTIDINNTAAQTTASGNIEANNNDDIQDVATGDSSSSVSLVNIANNVTSLSVPTGQTGTSLIIYNNVPASNLSFSNGNDLLQSANNDSSKLINVIANNNIANNIEVTATSGNVGLAKNDDVGDVKTGEVVADIAILNLANTVVSDGGVSVGIINLTGDYSGDIILDYSLMGLLGGPNSGSLSGLSQGNKTDLSVASTIGIVNDIEVNALSGTISSDGNDSVKSADTGEVLTIVDVNNLASSFTVYDNALLVIVTTNGEWNGSVLGNNTGNIFLITNGDSPNTLSVLPVGNLDSNIILNTSISNKVLVNALSGSINATGNDDVGALSTGNVYARVRVTNIVNHVVSYGNWIGVLFINVFGSWHGSVMLASPPPTDQNNGETTPTPEQYSQPVATPSSGDTSYVVPFIAFARASNSSTPVASTVSADEESPNTNILGAMTIPPANTPTTTAAENQATSLFWILIASLFITGSYAGYQILKYKNLELETV